MRRLTLAVLLVIGLLVAPMVREPRPVAAHPLGNFTVNRYSRIELAPGTVRVRYIVDMAEVPAFQERPAIDTDRDGRIDEAEATRYADTLAEALRRNLRLTVNGQAVELRLAERELAFPPGQGGLNTLRFAAWFAGALPAQDGVGSAEYRDDNYRDRLGWQEVVVRAGAGVALASSTAPETDESDELRAYPDDLLTSPLNVREARFSFAPGEGSAAAPARSAAGGALDRRPDRFAALITRELSLPVVLASLAVAMGLGALHALGPGHGKAVVAAYLVGSRGTTRHAVFLGLTVTLTHTSSVFALGLVTLSLSELILPEQLFPWLSFLSGGGIAVLGVALLVGRSRALLASRGRTGAHHQRHALAGVGERMRRHHTEHDHDHDHGQRHVHSHGGRAHSHLPPDADGGHVTWRGLLALGISGGILPCPSALVVLLTAISIHRVGYGMLLIVAFSVGLAGVLTVIGLLLVHARGLFRWLPMDSTVARVTPVASAAVVTALGVVIAVRALAGSGGLSV